MKKATAAPNKPPKEKVTQHFDMEAAFKAGTISKLTVDDLKIWLKSQGRNLISIRTTYQLFFHNFIVKVWYYQATFFKSYFSKSHFAKFYLLIFIFDPVFALNC